MRDDYAPLLRKYVRAHCLYITETESSKLQTSFPPLLPLQVREFVPNHLQSSGRLVRVGLDAASAGGSVSSEETVGHCWRRRGNDDNKKRGRGKASRRVQSFFVALLLGQLLFYLHRYCIVSVRQVLLAHLHLHHVIRRVLCQLCQLLEFVDDVLLVVLGLRQGRAHTQGAGKPRGQIVAVKKKGT